MELERAPIDWNDGSWVVWFVGLSVSDFSIESIHAPDITEHSYVVNLEPELSLPPFAVDSGGGTIFIDDHFLEVALCLFTKVPYFGVANAGEFLSLLPDDVFGARSRWFLFGILWSTVN
jgi:hypothetical protein